MQPEDKNEYIERYEKRLGKYGYSPETLGWGQHGRQEIRFGILAQEAIQKRDASILDVGCGFADLYDYLHRNGWQGQYTGLDIVPGLLQVAEERHPDLDVRLFDIMSHPDEIGMYDYVIASGIFNAKLQVDNHDHISQMLQVMHSKAKIATCVDFMSTYVDFQKEGSHHTDPAWAITQAMTLSRRVLLRQDYMPFEFAILIYKDDSRSQRNIFNAYEKSL